MKMVVTFEILGF